MSITGINLTPVTKALGEVVHYLQPIADLSTKVSKEVPSGEGQRTVVIIGRLYDGYAKNPFHVPDDIFQMSKAQQQYLESDPKRYPPSRVEQVKNYVMEVFQIGRAHV